MNKWLTVISLFIAFLGFTQEEDNTLYDHHLDENKWEKLRDGIRYEGQKNGPGRQWTYESNQEYNDAVKQYESGDGNGGNGGEGDGWGNGQGGNGGENGEDNGQWGPGDGANNKPQEPVEYDDYDPEPMDTPDVSTPSAGLGAFGYILMGVFIVALVFLIYYMYINSPKDGKKISGTIEGLDEVNPTEIPLTELQRMLQEALANNDYRGAVRIYFIFIIRDLAQKNWIKWEKEKTNFHYLREMSGKKEFDDFNRSVSYFEIIWYGKREIDANKFNEVKPNFTRLLDKLGVK